MGSSDTQLRSPRLLLLLAALLPQCTTFVVTMPSRAVASRRCCASLGAPKMLSAFMNNGQKDAAQADDQQQQASVLKQTIINEATGTSNGLAATPEQREAISKAVAGLVALNPTKDVTTSELATGTWDLLYTTTTGASGGKLGPFVGKVQQEVDIAQGLYVNYVRVGPLTGELEATWEVVNEKQWKVVFKTIAFLLFGQQLIKKDLGQEGLWTLSYLDNDMRVLTARSLERDTGNLYILART